MHQDVWQESTENLSGVRDLVFAILIFSLWLLPALTLSSAALSLRVLSQLTQIISSLNKRKGTFIRKNPVLENKLCELGVSEEVWDSILEAKGSVQHLDCLTPEEKEVFKTAREIDQFEIVKQAADRTPFICQAQSLNLFVPPDIAGEELVRLHLAAWKNGVKSLYYLRSTSLVAQRKVKPEAKVITKDGCPYCVKLKDQLKVDGISYVEVDRASVEDFPIQNGAPTLVGWRAYWRILRIHVPKTSRSK